MDDFDAKTFVWKDTSFPTAKAKDVIVVQRDSFARERLHHFFTALGFVGALADAAESIHYYQERLESAALERWS